jgi:hypothetical protein
MTLSWLIALLFMTSTAPAQTPAPPAATPPALTDQEMEQFLLTAEPGKSRAAGKGVTDAQRVTMRRGSFTHDAHVQTIDEQSSQGPGAGGRVEFNFRDSWMYNIAAYRLDRLLGLNLVPVAVERRFRSQLGAYSWWVDDVMMDERRRLERKLSPPDIERWNQEMQLVRIFDQLIYNVDRHVGNLIITNTWRIWAIDHTRAFRLHRQLKAPKDITRCDRALLERLRQLDKQTLSKSLGKYLTSFEIDALLARRDAIVALFDKAGPAALFDRGTSARGASQN